MHFVYLGAFLQLCAPTCAARCTTRANVTFGHRCQFSGPRARQCPETCAARESFLNVVQNGTCCCCCCFARGFPVLNTEGPLCDCKFDESNPNRAIWRGESAECYQCFWKGELVRRQTAMLMEYQGTLQFVGHNVQIRIILIAAVRLRISCYKCSEEYQACPRGQERVGGGKQRADLCHCLSKMLRCTFCNIISSGSVCSTLVLLEIDRKCSRENSLCSFYQMSHAVPRWSWPHGLPQEFTEQSDLGLPEPCNQCPLLKFVFDLRVCQLCACCP